jgi:hypothetical protein
MGGLVTSTVPRWHRASRFSTGWINGNITSLPIDAKRQAGGIPMDSELPVKYVLYSHYGYSDAQDFDEWIKVKQCA